jgi:drug/metabolite transporter (DMT)-like permease
MLSALTIFAASYAIEAGINFGVITSCIALSTPFNCLFSYIFFNERLTKKMCVGTLILFAGIMWVSLSKGESTTVDNEIAKWKAIGIALTIGVLNAVRTAHGKHVHIKYKYQPLEFSIDQGMLTGFICLILCSIYYIIGTESYNWYNLRINFLASTMRMLCALIALNAMVKGLAGPTSAILHFNSII